MACHPESFGTAEVQGSRNRDLAFTQLNEGDISQLKNTPDLPVRQARGGDEH
jgi:hypothetical protein